jgi:hypothetical protein
MSTTSKLTLQSLATTVGLVTAVIGAFGVYYILPYRVSATEKEIAAIKTQVESYKRISDLDHDLLLRIEERIINIQKQVNK